MSDFDPFAATIFADHGYRALPGQKHSLVMNRRRSTRWASSLNVMRRRWNR